MAWLGGYVTPEQAQLLGIRNSAPRVHVQLKDLEDWGFIKRVGVYPSIYQVKKSVTRLMGADLSARREHVNDTIRTRLLTVNFYLEAVRWPFEFVFDHQQKISKLMKIGCEPALFPQRGHRPYLWDRSPCSDHLAIWFSRWWTTSAGLRLTNSTVSSSDSLRNLGLDQLRLMVAVGSEQRERLFRRLLGARQAATAPGRARRDHAASGDAHDLPRPTGGAHPPPARHE